MNTDKAVMSTATHEDSDGTGYCRGCGTTIGESHHVDCDVLEQRRMLGNAKRSLVHLLLRLLRYHPGMVIDQGRRKYIVDNNGAWRRLGRDA